MRASSDHALPCLRRGGTCPAEHLASAFAALLALGVRDRAAFSAILRSALDAQPEILAAWSVWEPGALDGRDEAFRHAAGHDNTGRFVPCWHRAQGESQLDPVVGYERPGLGDWYWIPKRHGAACAVEPMTYPYAGHWRWITSQVVPLSQDGRFVGAVGIDCPADHPPRDASAENVRTAPLHRSSLESLTPREREVLHWLRLGKSNDEIAIILGISPHTVKNHLEHVFQKLEVNNRYEAILADG